MPININSAADLKKGHSSEQNFNFALRKMLTFQNKVVHLVYQFVA